MSRIKLNQSFDKKLIEHLGLTKFELALDIGSFTGDSVVGIQSMGYKHIVCIEPDPHNFDKLKSNYGKNATITLIKKAVSDKSEEIIKLCSTRNLPFLNSLDPKWLTKTRHNQFYRPNQYEEVDVETITIPDIIELVGKSPDYIKIDVEGWEKQVIRCIKEKPELVSFEWISERLDDNLSCISMLRDLGFSKFYICMGEELPLEIDEVYNYERCAIKFFELKEIDNDDLLGGNCFCL